MAENTQAGQSLVNRPSIVDMRHIVQRHCEQIRHRRLRLRTAKIIAMSTNGRSLRSRSTDTYGLSNRLLPRGEVWLPVRTAAHHKAAERPKAAIALPRIRIARWPTSNPLRARFALGGPCLARRASFCRRRFTGPTGRNDDANADGAAARAEVD